MKKKNKVKLLTFIYILDCQVIHEKMGVTCDK